MRLTIPEAGFLAEQSLCRLGYARPQADIIAAHLMDCELRGLGYGGLARILSIADRLGGAGPSATPMRTVKETAVSARIDGGDQVGYLVGEHATRLAVRKALAAGIGMVGANRTWYTGMLSYFAEIVVANGLVMMAASNASPWVAPHGGTEGRFGTNPICFAFPADDAPVIYDIGTSAIIHAEVVLARRLGRTLPDGVAFDGAGRSTQDPVAALAGAFAPWGGHRGSGLAIVVQLLGVLAGSPAMPGELADFGMVIMAMRPDLLTEPEVFAAEVSRYAERVRATRPAEGMGPVRMPFDRSRAERARRRASGVIEVEDAVVAALRTLSGAARPAAGQP